MTTKPSLSMLALNVYNDQGEKAMLNFIINNRATLDNNGKDPEKDPWKEDGEYLLKDNSAVHHLRSQGHYLFTGPTHEDLGETRPATLQLHEYPPYPPQNVPMMEWPNSDSVATKIAEQVSREARSQLGIKENYENVLNDYERLILAPGLPKAIHQSFEEANTNHMAEDLDNIENECADAAAGYLPEHEYEALLQAAMDKLRQQT